jgi:hypothetical protein
MMVGTLAEPTSLSVAGTAMVRSGSTPIVEERRCGYAFEGAIAFDRMLAGVVDFPPNLASPKGPGLDYHPIFQGNWVSDRKAA